MVTGILNSNTTLDEFVASLKQKNLLKDDEAVGTTKDTVEETKWEDDDAVVTSEHDYNNLIGKRVKGKTAGWTRYYPGKICKIIDENNTVKFKVHFDDGDRWILRKRRDFGL